MLLATIAVGLVWCRLSLAPRESFRSRTIVGFVTLAVALAFMPNLPWWVGLVMTPCLLGDERSRFRIVGVWWLLMSILTPLYHPYARLWLPLHAAGWLMMGALIAQALSGYVDGSLRSESPADPPRPLAVDTAGSTSGGRRDRRWGSKGLRRGSVGLTCVLLAFCFDRISPPHAHPSPRLLGPTNGLSNVVAIMSREEVVQDGLRILASPPLEFYLRLERVPLVLHRDVDQLLKPAPGLQWALVDEVILRQESDPDRARVRLFRQCEVVDEATWDLGLVAALDVDPGLAVRDSQPPRPHVWLLRPKPRKAD